MSPAIKNISTILVAASLAFLGYYLYKQNQNAGLSYGDGSYSTEQMLNNTQVFIERRALLEKVTLNTDIFIDPVFESLKSYRSPEVVVPVGRDNPFARDTGASL